MKKIVTLVSGIMPVVIIAVFYSRLISDAVLFNINYHDYYLNDFAGYVLIWLLVVFIFSFFTKVFNGKDYLIWIIVTIFISSFSTYLAIIEDKTGGFVSPGGGFFIFPSIFLYSLVLSLVIKKRYSEKKHTEGIPVVK